MRFYKPPEWHADSTIVYLSILVKIPFPHVATAIVEWLEHFKWMPQPSEWREIALRHWSEAEREKRLRNPRIEQKPEEPLKPGDLRAYAQEVVDGKRPVAEGTRVFCESYLKRCESNDCKRTMEQANA